jgi:S1-C subfamily serine protease
VSTHLYHSQRLGREHLIEIGAHGFDRIELFATRTHFDYHSPAAVADIQRGDVITEVGRNQVTNSASFQKALADQKGKPNILLLLDRKGVKTYSIVKVGK